MEILLYEWTNKIVYVDAQHIISTTNTEKGNYYYGSSDITPTGLNIYKSMLMISLMKAPLNTMKLKNIMEKNSKNLKDKKC